MEKSVQIFFDGEPSDANGMHLQAELLFQYRTSEHLFLILCSESELRHHSQSVTIIQFG